MNSATIVFITFCCFFVVFFIFRIIYYFDDILLNWFKRPHFIFYKLFQCENCKYIKKKSQIKKVIIHNSYAYYPFEFLKKYFCIDCINQFAKKGGKT